MKFKIITMNNFYKDLKFPSREIYGSYLSSDFSPIPGYNHKVFMIAFNLDYRLYSPIDFLDIENYARDCIESLNNTPKNKRDKTPLLGNLTFYSARVFTHKSGNKYIQVRALSDEKKNKMLFRLGDEVEQVPSLKERKEEKKRELEEANESGDEKYMAKVEKLLTEAPKKRGRPPKAATKTVAKVENKTPKKRGRPSKNKK
jgi:hypothetical protein